LEFTASLIDVLWRSNR